MEREKIEQEIIHLKAAVYDCWAVKEQAEQRGNQTNKRIEELVRLLATLPVAEPPAGG